MEVTGYNVRNIKGKWHAIVYWKDETGKRHQKSTKLDTDMPEKAREMAMECFYRCKTGDIPLKIAKKGTETIYSYAETYFKGRLERHEYERSTFATNMKHMRAWKRALGDKSPLKVQPNDIKDVISTWFSEGRDATTVDKRITALKEVYNAAILDGTCSSNPLEHIKRPKKGWKMLNGCNDADSRWKIADKLRKLPLDSMKVAFNLAMWTGMRRGEVCGLQWCNIDLERRVIWVRSAIGTDDVGKYLKPPKSDRPRDIAMPEYLHSLLSSWYFECKRRFGVRFTPQVFVVCDSAGNYLNPDYITHRFTALASFEGWKGAAGRRLTLHDLRHTVATALITDGADVKTVQSVLGHSSAAITLDMYASADSRAKRDAADMLELSIRKSAPKDALTRVGTLTERRCTEVAPCNCMVAL